MKSNNIVVLAPDKRAGEDFVRVMRSEFKKSKKKVSINLKIINVPPRVIGNKITPEIKPIENKLEIEFDDLINTGETQITISCNTLSLPIFTENIKSKFAEKIRFITTLDAIKNHIGEEKERILLIGTKALIDNFPYKDLINVFKKDTELDLSQEIIWRTKSYQKSDITTAFDYPSLTDRAKNLELLKIRVNQLLDLINKYNFKSVIMGCTELPDAISLLPKKKTKGIVFIDPAELVARQLVK